MALPRFSFSGGATDFFQPNQALFRTTFTPSDKLQSDTYQAEAKAYKDAVEKHNEALKVNPDVDPPKPTPLSFTQEEFDQFGVDASRRAQQLQNAKQNAFNAISNPSGFSQQYGIGSLGFGDGGEVPFFLEAQPRKSNVPSPEELNEALLRYFPVLQLLNKTSKIFTKTIPDMAKTSVRMIKSPESKDEEFEQLQLRTKDQADSILNMFGTSTEKLIPRAKEPVYKTKFENGGAVGPDVASLRPSETSMGLSPYGVRHSGEGLKGKGYFGEIQSPSGQSVTEYSLYDEDIGEYPSIVPTLTAEELQDTIRRSSQGEQPSIEVIMKARMYAKDRLSDGKSTFSGPTELRFPVPSNTDDDMIRRIDAYLEKNRP